MIVIDTSALMAITLDEATATACLDAIEASGNPIISAGTFAELLIVAAGRGVADQMGDVLADARLDIRNVTEVSARRIGEAYRRWGRGFHPAALNYGDCFAYELATSLDCPLLFVGDDFTKTDVKRAL